MSYSSACFSLLVRNMNRARATSIRPAATVRSRYKGSPTHGPLSPPASFAFSAYVTLNLVCSVRHHSTFSRSAASQVEQLAEMITLQGDISCPGVFTNLQRCRMPGQRTGTRSLLHRTIRPEPPRFLPLCHRDCAHSGKGFAPRSRKEVPYMQLGQLARRQVLL